MKQLKVTPLNQTADTQGFRKLVAAECRGDARPRPLDCTGRRFLVRDDYHDAFSTTAGRFGLRVEPDRGR